MPAFVYPPPCHLSGHKALKAVYMQVKNQEHGYIFESNIAMKHNHDWYNTCLISVRKR